MSSQALIFVFVDLQSIPRVYDPALLREHLFVGPQQRCGPTNEHFDHRFGVAESLLGGQYRSSALKLGFWGRARLWREGQRTT